MNKSIVKYREALDRLVQRKGVFVKGNYEINLDTIALECGLKRGSIRKKRLPIDFLDDLISASNQHAEQIDNSVEIELDVLKGKYSELDSSFKELTVQYEAAIAREMNLAYELMSLKKELTGTITKVVKFDPMAGRFK